MKESTKEILMTVLGSDTTVTTEQVELVLGVLAGRELKEMTKEIEPYITLKEAAKRLGISTTTLWRWKVPGHQFGGHRRFRLSEIEEYLHSRELKERTQELREMRREDGAG